MTTPYLPPSYFAPSYFAPSYSGGAGAIPPVSSGGGYFPGDYFARSYFAPSYFPESAGSAVVQIEPNPAETVWTLGPDGAVVTLSVATGFAATFATQLLNAGVPLVYDSATPDSALDAVVWAGAGEGILFAPTMAWIDPTLATLTLSVAPGQLGVIGAGEFRIQVGVTIGGVRSLAYDGIFEVIDAPGSTAAPLLWCSQDDMLLRSSQVRTLLSQQAHDAAGYASQIAEATLHYKRKIEKRYLGIPAFTRTRQVVHHLIFGKDLPTPSAAIPNSLQLSTALSTPGGIVLEDQLREIIARHAIALVLGRQFNNREYQAEAAQQSAAAHERFYCYQAQILTASPIGGNTNFLIDRDCIILPAGTAP